MSAAPTRPRLVIRRPPATAIDETFRALGTDVRLVATGTGARAAVTRARAEILDYHARLSRFLESSELSLLNADPRHVVPTSALLRSAVEAGLWAARMSGGLVDPCLLGALEAAGYERSFEPGGASERTRERPRPGRGSQDDPKAGRSARRAPAPGAIAEPAHPGADHGGARTVALDHGGARMAAVDHGCARTAALEHGCARMAAPDPAARWRTISIDNPTGTIARPPGLRLDLGGSGKGHIADLVARRFAALDTWVVDCGGDIRVGGTREIEVEHPLRKGEPSARLTIADGAIATSSIVSRAWTARDGRRRHHLLDPCTGEPVHSGLLSATALAATTLHAETLAKVALLSGPRGARRALARRGGVLVHTGGDVETIEPVR